MGFIMKGLVSEKMRKIREKEGKGYGLVVGGEGNKVEIKKEVESVYNVRVVEVKSIGQGGKGCGGYRKGGVVKGEKNGLKKGIVSVKEGDRIDFQRNI